jgi:hypothetical protein
MTNAKPVILSPTLGLTKDQQDCVEVLRQALEIAEEGKISSVAVVACMEGGYAAVMGGNRPADLNLGLDDMKDQILQAVRAGARHRASIIRAR